MGRAEILAVGSASIPLAISVQAALLLETHVMYCFPTKYVNILNIELKKAKSVQRYQSLQILISVNSAATSQKVQDTNLAGIQIRKPNNNLAQVHNIPDLQRKSVS
jgi:hypothetical protein